MCIRALGQSTPSGDIGNGEFSAAESARVDGRYLTNESTSGLGGRLSEGASYAAQLRRSSNDEVGNFENDTTSWGPRSG